MIVRQIFSKACFSNDPARRIHAHVFEDVWSDSIEPPDNARSYQVHGHPGKLSKVESVDLDGKGLGRLPLVVKLECPLTLNRVISLISCCGHTGTAISEKSTSGFHTCT